jgi:N-acetylmuramoyl-L-alanine amidase
LFLNLTGKQSILKRYFIFLYLIFLVLVQFSQLAGAEANVTVRDIKHYSSPDYTRIVIDLSGPVEFSKNRLSNPDRVYFDLKNSVITKEIKTSLPVGDGILKTVRASQFSGNTVRVVCDIEEISDFKSFILDDPSRLVIDLYGKGTKVEKQNTKAVKRRIVIDAGHGGHDPGAVGPNKLYEKNVVLDIALKLKKILKSDPSNEVFLTRESDVFIPLEERTAIANKKNADLFVSIHANASPRKQAKGIETYLLNWTDDETAMRVAARENAISMKKMKALNRQMDIVSVITNDLMRQNKRDESLKLANYIQKSMVSGLESDCANLTDLGVKQALFYVLFGAKMPSVLVEVSFISNPEEEALLSREAYRVHIAKAIADGLHTYISSSFPAQKIVGLRDDRTQIR